MQIHDAVILAAGGSRRLGRIKQNLTIGGETLLMRTVRLTAATRPGRLVVVLGASADELAAGLPADDVLINPRWRDGMASSLRLAAEVLKDRDRPVLVAVVDQPALTQAHLDGLIAAYDGTRDVVSAYGSVRGVPVLLRPGTLQRARDLAGDEGFRQLWRTEQPFLVRQDDLALDVDTEDDVRTAVRLGRLDPLS